MTGEVRIGDGRYEILGDLARGAFKSVYRARDHALNLDVALAVLHPQDDEAESRVAFWRETRAVAMLKRDVPARVKPFVSRVVTMTDFGELSDPRPYRGLFIATEMVEGRTLRDLRDELPMDWRRAFRIGAGILEALELSHTPTPHRGPIIHRDIKPANVIVGPGDAITVIDFGVAKLAESTKTALSQIVGTPQYMAPEQLDEGGAIGPSVDLFSVGVILHELLTGHVPWSRNNLAEVFAFYRATKEGVPLALEMLDAIELPRAVDVILRASLAANPHARPESAIEMRDVLLAAAGNTQLGAAPPPATHVAGPDALGANQTADAPPSDTDREPLREAPPDTLRDAPTPPRPPEPRPAPREVKAEKQKKKEPKRKAERARRPKEAKAAAQEVTLSGRWIAAAIVGLAALVLGVVWYARARPAEYTIVSLAPPRGEAPSVAAAPPVVRTEEDRDAPTERETSKPERVENPAADFLDAAETALLTDRLDDADAALTRCLEIEPDNKKCRQTYGILAARGYRRDTGPGPEAQPIDDAARVMNAWSAADDATPTTVSARSDGPSGEAPRGPSWIRLESPKEDIDLLGISAEREIRITGCVKRNPTERRGRPDALRVHLLVRHDGFPARVRVGPEGWSASRVAICLENLVMGWRFPEVAGEARPAFFDIVMSPTAP